MDGYRCVFPVEVRFRDLDAMGHVNNAVYLTYLEDELKARLRTQDQGGPPGVTGAHP